MRFALLFVLLAVSPAAVDLVTLVRGAIDEGNLPKAVAYIRDYRATRTITPELLTAMSWVARGELARKGYDRAQAYAQETYQASTDMLRRRALDSEPNLPLALGASIEVQGQVLAARGQRTEAVTYLNEQLAKFRETSIAARIQKNIHLLSLEGKPAPALQGVTLPKGKPVLLFFWAHWCSDCRGEVPIFARLKTEFAPKGLTLIGATQKYGYVAGGVDAAPDVETRYIETVRKENYSSIVSAPAVVNEQNFLNYGVSTTPTLVLVDRQGIVRLYHPGRMTYEELRPKIQALR